jgi:hypothetical protein
MNIGLVYFGIGRRIETYLQKDGDILSAFCFDEQGGMPEDEAAKRFFTIFTRIEIPEFSESGDIDILKPWSAEYM